MGIKYWLRVVLMIVAFIGVVLIIREMNQPLDQRRARAFGAFTGADAPRVDLCPTRVTAMELGDGQTIREEGLTWIRRPRAIEGAAPEVKLDPVAVEKWFSTFCRVGDITKVAPSADLTPVLKFAFVAGPPQTLNKTPAGDFEWRGQTFRSEELGRALAVLRELPSAANR